MVQGTHGSLANPPFTFILERLYVLFLERLYELFLEARSAYVKVFDMPNP
jgi:hypothetical protein